MITLHRIYRIDNQPVIKLKDFAKKSNYSDKYLLKIIKRLAKKKIRIAYKWKRNWYIFISGTLPANSSSTSMPSKSVELPNGEVIDLDWQEVVKELPPPVAKELVNLPPIEPGSSTLTLKTGTYFIPLSMGKFAATTEYKYGYSIKYDPNKMSIFNPGSAGTLSSTQIPSAFFEVCRALDAAENLRNGANPGLPPRRNLSTTVSFDTGTIAIAATIPVEVSVQASGSIDIKASDYLGATYSVFNAGGGDLKSDTLPEALLELASILAAAEKAVTPTDSQPNNVQIQFDLETGSATVSANLPFTTSAATNGDVTVHAIDYL